MARILMVDDEPNFLNATATALRKAGYAVTEATNANDGFHLACKEPFDLIISDICMTGGDGISLLKQIRSTPQTSTVPFIFISGNADQDIMVVGAEEAADGILPKPFTLQTLYATVEKRVKRETILRKRTESIRQQLQKILEGSPDLIGIVDPENGHFLFLNQSGKKLLRCELTEGISFEGVHAFDDAQYFQSVIMPQVNRDGIWSGETTLRRMAGESFPVRECVQAHRDEEGRLSYISVIAHDLSEAKRLEKERKLMELELTQAHKLESIGQLAAGIAHEINTPTQYIGDNTRFLEDAFTTVTNLLTRFSAFISEAKAGTIAPASLAKAEDELQKADLEFLLREIPQAIAQSLEGLERVTKIVRAMKDFSHPGVVEKTPIDINQAIESTITVARNEWKYVANVELDLDRSLPLVSCVPGELNQLILNLIVNAAHAIEDVVKNSNSKGLITISSRRNAAGIEIRVCDTGGGIPDRIRNKIFEPFFTTKKIGKGTGQGLAIARSVVIKHGGTIDFESESGRGTVFRIALPIS